VYWDKDRTKYSAPKEDVTDLNEKIDEATAKILHKLIEDKGKDLAKILEYYKVKSLEDMTKEQAGKLKIQLSKAS
jgi:hypothetical protein